MGFVATAPVATVTPVRTPEPLLTGRWRWLDWEPLPAVATLLALGFFVLATFLGAYGPVPDADRSYWGMAIQLPTALLLFARRRIPVTVGVVVTACSAVMLASVYLAPGTLVPTYNPTAQWVPIATPVTVYNLVVHGRNRIAVWALAGLLALIAVRPWAYDQQVSPGGMIFTVLPAVLGLAVLRARRERRLLAEQARAEERVRLAGEMHDMVTHRVSLMVLQAGALRVSAADEATRRAAEDLRTAGCQALDELRDLVGVLRAEPGEGERPVAGPTPVPDLSALVAESRQVGVEVRLQASGDPLLASPAVARTAYRVVQEALTNVRKHAPGAPAEVRVRYGGDRVRLTVRNPAPDRASPDVGLAASGSGTGLLGLRQRVELVGGSLRFGPVEDGGFQVTADLPAYVPTSTPSSGASR